MKTTSWTRKQFRQLAGAGVLFLTGCVAGAYAQQTNAPAASAGQPKTPAASSADADEELDNWVEVGVGGNTVSGNKAQFQKQSGLPADTAYGGITAFHYETPVAKKGLFSVDGRGIFDNHDYDLKLDVQHPDVGYVQAGIREYRQYYDGAGGFLPSNGLSFAPVNSQLFMDRETAFIEGGLTLPGWPVLKVRYEHDERYGDDDSTEWGTTTLTGPGHANNTSSTLGQKKIAPSYLGIDEKTDFISADLSHTIKNTDVGIGLRYDWIRNTDTQNDLLFPGQNNAQGDSHTLNQMNGDKNGMINVHAFTDTTVSDKVEVTTGYSYTSMQDEIFGSRLDTPNVAVGADTRFANLVGTSDMEQYELNANVMYTPLESLYIVPALRVEKEDLAGNDADNAVTGTGNGVIGALTSNAETESTINLAESLDVRYNGITNVVFYIRADWEENRANVAELSQTLPALPVPALMNNWHEDLQKYSIGANWYPLRGLNFAAQYYHKLDENNYENPPAATPTYPNFIVQENFIVDDVNFRVSWRPSYQITLVSRYDFQTSAIDMQGGGLSAIESGKNLTQMFSESLSWTPLNRIYLELGLNYVLDTTHTPADSLTEAAAGGVPITGVVQPSQNNYWTVNGSVGYAINDKTEVSATYVYYRASDYSDNSAIGVPYGAGGEQHNVSAKLQRQINKRLRWALTYSFASYRDDLFGGNIDYTAQSVFSSVQYRF
jgi:hypothetical protein